MKVLSSLVRWLRRAIGWIRNIVSLAMVPGIVLLGLWASWNFAGMWDGDELRFRAHYATVTSVPKGTKLRDEHLQYRFGRIEDDSPIAHHTNAVGRFALVDLKPDEALARGTISVVPNVAPVAGTALVTISVDGFFASHLSSGMRVAFVAAATADPPPEDPVEADGEKKAAEAAKPVVVTEKAVKQLGFGNGGYSLVSVSTISESDSLKTVLGVSVPASDSVALQELPARDWRPVVLSEAIPAVPTAPKN
jgi:hypothetical protein